MPGQVDVTLIHLVQILFQHHERQLKAAAKSAVVVFFKRVIPVEHVIVGHFPETVLRRFIP